MAHRDFKISQQAIIYNDKNEILILRNHYGDWLLPGGRVEENEDPFNTLTREVREETGFDVEILNPVEVDISSSGKTFAIAYDVKILKGTDLKISTEHTEFLWAKPEQLPKLLHYKRIAKTIAERLQ